MTALDDRLTDSPTIPFIPCMADEIYWLFWERGFWILSRLAGTLNHKTAWVRSPWGVCPLNGHISQRGAFEKSWLACSTFQPQFTTWFRVTAASLSPRGLSQAGSNEIGGLGSPFSPVYADATCTTPPNLNWPILSQVSVVNEFPSMNSIGRGYYTTFH